MSLQDLLGPTWKQRVRAADALLPLLAHDDGRTASAAQVQQLLSKLQPSPEIFLRALLAFWGMVAERQLCKRAGEALPASDSRRWGDPNLETFPLDRALASLPAGGMHGMWVWMLLEHLGSMAELIEAELLNCLSHPEPMVTDAVEKALGAASRISDAAFERFLAHADAKGGDGYLHVRTAALA